MVMLYANGTAVWVAQLKKRIRQWHGHLVVDQSPQHLSGHGNHERRFNRYVRLLFSLPFFLPNDVKNAYSVAASNFFMKSTDTHLLYKTSNNCFGFKRP